MSPRRPPPDPQAIARAIGASAKYRHIAPETIADVVRQVAAAGHHRDVEAAARDTLHRVVAAYHGPEVPRRLAPLGAALAATADPEQRRALCREVLALHLTARERFPLIEADYYPRLFAITGIPATVADLAAALHPFELPWMGLPAGTAYLALDNNARYVEAAGAYLAQEGVGTARVQDVLVTPVSAPCDLAFFLMTYHMVEGRIPGGGLRIIEQTNARWLAVSLPVQNLGGRSRGFAGLAAELGKRLTALGWRYEILDWPSERLFVIERGQAPPEIPPENIVEPAPVPPVQSAD